MTYLLNAREIVESAVFIEQNGYQFYVKAMKKFDDPQILELFQYLADEEFKHENIFKNLLGKLTPQTPSEAGAHDTEYEAYLAELCKSHLLANSDAVRSHVESIRNMDDAVALALRFEKDSVVFFTELKAVMGADRAGAVDKVIAEEMGHVRKLVQIQSARGLKG